MNSTYLAGRDKGPEKRRSFRGSPCASRFANTTNPRLQAHAPKVWARRLPKAELLEAEPRGGDPRRGQLLARWQIAIAGQEIWTQEAWAAAGRVTHDEDLNPEEMLRQFARYHWVADAIGVLRTLGVFARLVWHRSAVDGPEL